MILIDGVKFNLFVPEDEKQLEEMVKEHAKEIFGQDTVYFDLKQKIISKSGIGSIPDGYVIDLSRSAWYIVEVELSSHPLHEHVTGQLNRFWVGIKNLNAQRELIDALHKEIVNDKILRAYVESKIGAEIKGFLLDLISRTPKIVVIVEEMGKKVEEACDGLKAEPTIVEFKTFARENAQNIHAHLFEPLTVRGIKPPNQKGKATGQKEFAFPILESLIEMGGAGKAVDVLEKMYGKMKSRLTERDHEKIPRGNMLQWEYRARWELTRLRNEGYLKKDSPRNIREITEAGRKLYEDLRSKAHRAPLEKNIEEC